MFMARYGEAASRFRSRAEASRSEADLPSLSSPADAALVEILLDSEGRFGRVSARFSRFEDIAVVCAQARYVQVAYVMSGVTLPRDAPEDADASDLPPEEIERTIRNAGRFHNELLRISDFLTQCVLTQSRIAQSEAPRLNAEDARHAQQMVLDTVDTLLAVAGLGEAQPTTLLIVRRLREALGDQVAILTPAQREELREFLSVETARVRERFPSEIERMLGAVRSEGCTGLCARQLA